MKYTKTLIASAVIIGMSTIWFPTTNAEAHLFEQNVIFVNNLSNSVHPTISPIFNTENIFKKIQFGSGGIIDLSSILKNFSEITGGNNAIQYHLKDKEKYNGINYSEKTKTITVDKTTEPRDIKLNFEVCTEGKEIAEEAPRLPSITRVINLPK